MPCSEAGVMGLACTHSNALSLSAVALRRALESFITDVSFIKSCGRMTFCKKWFAALFSSLGETKYALNPGQILSRNYFHLSHNSSKDHDIYKVGFRTILVSGMC